MVEKKAKRVSSSHGLIVERERERERFYPWRVKKEKEREFEFSLIRECRDFFKVGEVKEKQKEKELKR